MTTTLNVSLSQTLQSELGQQGVWAYAVYFDITGNNPAWTNLVINGGVQDSGTVAIPLPFPFPSGKIYFIIQSQASTQPNNLVTLITAESDVNWTNANNYDFRYDSFEVTLQNSSSDVANLTSVNGFGLPMGVSVAYSNGSTATVGYNISGSTLVEDIQAINPSNTYTDNYASGPLNGDFRMALSPTEALAVGSPVFQPSDWKAYVKSLESLSTIGIVLSGLFNGAADASGVWHNGGYFAYQLQMEMFVPGRPIFWLVPLSSSQIKGNIQLTEVNLENSIYSTLGTANIFTNMSDTTAYLANMNTGANNQWGKVLSEFLTGFTAGFYNTSGKSLNSQVSTPIDLNENMNWEPVYAFGQNLESPPPSYQASDPYAQIFYANSNSYGSGYSDALMSQYAVGGPLISVSDPGTGLNVANINLTIFADGDTPTGYTVPEIYNYIKSANGYQAPSASNNGLNISLYLAAAVANNAGVVLDSTATITLNILTSDAGDTPVWSTVTFDGASEAAGQYGLWQIWDITNTDGVYSAAPPSVPQPKSAGTILINSFPIPAATNAVCWYQIQIGTKIFNLYTTTIGGQFANPNYAGQQGWLAIDGLATISPQASQDQSIGTFTVNFSVGDTVTIDPSLLTPNTANVNPPPPSCPVAGTISGGEFTALANQDSLVSNTITTTETEIAFAWTGENSSSNTVSWISGYTNKIDAETVARITITPTVGSPITTTATADIDGQWQTSPVTLQAGTYTVTMTEYLASDTQFSNPMTPPSSVLTLTVSA